MNRTGLAAVVLVAVAGGPGHAESLNVHDLYRKAEAAVQSLLAPPPVDREVIKAPDSVDSKMALAPPAGGTMRLLEPSRPFRQR